MNMYIILLIVTQVFDFSSAGVISSDLTSVKVTKRSDESLNLHFIVSGTTRRSVLTPSSIFATDFKSWSTDHKYPNVLIPYKEVSQRGNFYSVDGSHGTVRVVDDLESPIVEGIIDGNLHIKPRTSGSNLHLVTRQLPLNSHTQLKYNAKLPVPAKLRQTRDKPSNAILKILIVLDYNNSMNLDFDQDKIKKYLGVFWNSVNQRFAKLTNPTLQLSITGLITINSTESEPFITNNAEDDSRVDENVLKDFKNWLNSQRHTLPQHDVAMLQATANGGKIVSGKLTDSVIGLAYVGMACKSDHSNCGFFEDRAPTYNGVLTAAHELAHLLNAPHDGEDAASDCPATDGYIMGHSKFDENSWQFSTCSLSIMTDFLQSNLKQCFSDSDNTDDQVIPLVTEYPAETVVSLDQQCRDREHNDRYQFWGSVTEDICKALWCGPKGSSHATTLGGAVEGTPCNIQKICVDGVCVSNGIPSLDDQCKVVFGDDSAAAQKNDPNVCLDLQCVSGTDQASAGPAAEGSSCGNCGVCKSGTCSGEVPSFDEQCSRNFDDDHKAVEKDANEMCSQLWCTADGSKLVSIGAANENTNCGDNQVCQNGQCIPL